MNARFGKRFLSKFKTGFHWPRDSRRKSYNEVSDYVVKDDSKF